MFPIPVLLCRYTGSIALCRIVMSKRTSIMLNPSLVMLNEVKHLYAKDPSLALRMTT